MRYYGIKNKNREDKIEYSYAKLSTMLRGYLPGKNRDFFRHNYSLVFEHNHKFRTYPNGIPDGHFLKLNQIVTSDIIYREDIKKLQSGIKTLLRKHRAGSRFIQLHMDSLEEICSRIDRMDDTLLSWYDFIECGVFELCGSPLENSVDYFTMRVTNTNSSFLSLEFSIFLTEAKMDELDEIINADYHEYRGYAKKILASSKKGGAFRAYTLVQYPDEALKADRIMDWFGCMEWEFYHALQSVFPFVLHKKGIMPPRIEVYYTDIDYHDDNNEFWKSVGVDDYKGQFIDIRQKVFFGCYLSGRHKTTDENARLIYIIKDDGIKPGQFRSVKDKAFFHIKDYSREYFRFMFLDILSRQAGEQIIRYKHRLDKTKLRQNRLKQTLKLRYEFECELDSYARYARDNNWERGVDKLATHIYRDSDEILEKIDHPLCTTYKMFCGAAISGARKIDRMIGALRNEFDEKEKILQQLSDYKNSEKNWILNIAMLIITAATLFFVVFPHRAEWLADIIRNLIKDIMRILGHL